ncbi:MAG: glycosyltransferase [Chloroflexi bacterium]|nr:glycosyltransferase [Chloroflexota bacterium]
MRIVQILDTLWMGGAQKMQVFLAHSLNPLGVDLTVVNLSHNADSTLVSQLEEAGVRVVSFPFPRMFSPLSFARLVIFLQRERFDLIHAYLTYSNIIAPLAGRLSGIPVIASIRSADYRHHKNSPRVRMENFSLKYLAHRVLANGYAVGEFARTRCGNTPVDVIVNAVDLIPPLQADERTALRSDLVGDSARSIILSVGRLTVAKGFFDLLDAFKIVHASQPNAALVIAGDGNLYDDLTKYAAELNLQNDVFFLGSRSDVVRLLPAADIYVNSSLREGTPVSVLEAMSAGLAVVATTVGENSFLLSQSSGMLVPPGQPDKLAEAVISLLASPEKRAELGQAARALIGEKYGRIEWSRNILTLYAKLTPKANKYLRKIEDGVLQAVGFK